MNAKDSNFYIHIGKRRSVGFTLTELLVVIAVIGLLAALLLPALSRVKSEAQSTACKNHLSQIGHAMAMYVSDNHKYPPVFGGPPFQTWADYLTSYYPLNWTNASWNCPTYNANKGIVKFSPPPQNGSKFVAWTSYSFNAFGMSGFNTSDSRIFRHAKLGLGDLNLTVSEQQVSAPSEMYAVADARPFAIQGVPGFVGSEIMSPWHFGIGVLSYNEGNPPHSQGYNLLFNDAHVSLVKRKDYLYPPRSARNWNRDNQPHPEAWSPTNEWVIQN